MSYENFAGIPKRLKGQAWKACRSVTRCQGSNPCSCAIEKKLAKTASFFNAGKHYKFYVANKILVVKIVVKKVIHIMMWIT